MNPIPKFEIAVAPDGSEPVVSLADIKSFLRVDGTEDDLLITALVTAATQRLEDFISRKFITQQWKIYFDFWPSQYAKDDPWWDGVRDGAIGSLISPVRYVDLPFGPLNSVATITTYDDADVAYVFDASNYQADTKGLFGRIGLKIGCTWPPTILRPANGIEILGTFGMSATAGGLPTTIVQAVKLTVAKMYENRGDNTQSEFFGASGFTIPSTAQMLLEPMRRFRLGR